MALRDKTYFAQACGESEWKPRLATFAVNASFAGISGAFYASNTHYASPGVFGIGSLTLVLSILLLGVFFHLSPLFTAMR